ncbi:hypothetical protein NC651_029873 [Populus alba x Populus x berolinensis]|nr:hypothetical protein NC651_029873 [Populus alba x Populus x berolinensis]
MLSKHPSKSSSHAVITERTILSPFTKEYRVLTANCGLRQFLDGSLPYEESLYNSSSNVSKLWIVLIKRRENKALEMGCK